MTFNSSGEEGFMSVEISNYSRTNFTLRLRHENHFK